MKHIRPDTGQRETEISVPTAKSRQSLPATQTRVTVGLKTWNGKVSPLASQLGSHRLPARQIETLCRFAATVAGSAKCMIFLPSVRRSR